MSPFLSAALSGAAATAAGIGLARFAFVPLFPALVEAGWVSGAEAGLLGAAALAGYLIGVMGAQALGRRLGTRGALRLGMAAVFLSLALCAVPGGVAWLLPWRLLAGVAGGVLMSLAGPSVQRAVEAARRGTASGIVIAGVGGGITLGALILPPLLQGGPAPGWLGIAALALGLAIFAHCRFPEDAGGIPPGAPPAAPRLLLAYALSGAGMVPPMVYLSDFAARGVGVGVLAGSGIWALFGLGALAGTLLGGRAADGLGGAVSVRLWLGVQAAALGLALLPHGAALAGAAVLGGFSGVGISAVTLAWAREMAGPQAGALWVRATLVYAAAQAGAAVALAVLFGITGESHAAVFAAGLACSLGALIPAMFHRP
ncbi:YbfB/YjiJ family MFS transporter [Sabulicella glaciei]|uniref:MFS transporter n=1 Tax=Sabulicella glaciei TaxID=2984948 RepID=A0ABT3NPF9_9PROT|nr:YbfB/YjiJ family MFS transporter [Roseococcus sp. MDT2-1-1]MCW8084050.1 MFS transporter [Roseococcus sp. MDT2-1-1]